LADALWKNAANLNDIAAIFIARLFINIDRRLI